MKKTMSISTSLFLGRIVLGALWIIIAVVNFFDGIFWTSCSIVLLLAAVAILVVQSKIQPGNEDEMSDYNYKEAKAKASDIMYVVCMFIATAAVIVLPKLNTENWDWPVLVGNIFYILVGVQNLMVGIFFRKLEAE